MDIDPVDGKYTVSMKICYILSSMEKYILTMTYTSPSLCLKGVTGRSDSWYSHIANVFVFLS